MPDQLVAERIAPSILSTCRACLAPDPYQFMAMGSHAPAQMLIKPEDRDRPQPSFPLNPQVCLQCGLVEIADQIPADFFRHYLYVPSGATLMHNHFAGLANVLVERAKGGLIVDIGCNDGLLLGACNERGGKTLGVDPAANIAAQAEARGVEVVVDYFDPAMARQLLQERGPASVIVTTNTFNHIGDLHHFMEGIAILLSADGSFVIEVPRAKELIDHCEFENLYHEHVSEFSLLSIVRLGAFFGLEVTDVHRLPHIHGGSMRVFLTRTGAGVEAAPIVAEMLAEEAAGHMLEEATYDQVARRADAMGVEVRAMLDDLKARGKRVAGYGASARGNTLLTYFGIGTQYLDYIVDKNPLKHGLYSPNMRIPIRPVEALEQDPPDVLFVLAWNFFDEIRAQQAAFEARGGQFLVALPEPRLIG